MNVILEREKIADEEKEKGTRKWRKWREEGARIGEREEKEEVSWREEEEGGGGRGALDAREWEV